MRGYPKFIATRQDYENLLKMPEFAKQAKADLEALAKVDTAKVTRAIRPVDPDKPDGEWVTEEITNPKLEWKRKGFETAKEVSDLAKIPAAAAEKFPAPTPDVRSESPQIIEPTGVPPVQQGLGSRIGKGIIGLAKKMWPKR